MTGAVPIGDSCIYINLEVSAGETIALVGRSGAGKTTFCNLVARFYDPSSGAILLDDKNLTDIHVGSYRRLLGVKLFSIVSRQIG